MTATIRRLERTDDLNDFQAPPVFERFLKEFAGQNQHHIGTTYIAIEDKTVLGYATVAMASVPADDMPAKLRKRLPSYPVPLLRIVQMAVDERRKGTGVGTALLRFALSLANELSGKIGCAGVLADAIPGAVDIYAKHGFEKTALEEGSAELKASTTPMFLSLGTIKKGLK